MEDRGDLGPALEDFVTSGPWPPDALRVRPPRHLEDRLALLHLLLVAGDLRRDAADPHSQHDFGRDIIPSLIGTGSVYAYGFIPARLFAGMEGAPGAAAPPPTSLLPHASSASR